MLALTRLRRERERGGRGREGGREGEGDIKMRGRETVSHHLFDSHITTCATIITTCATIITTRATIITTCGKPTHLTVSEVSATLSISVVV